MRTGRRLSRKRNREYNTQENYFKKCLNSRKKGGYMHADVQVIEGGRLIKTEKMKLTKVKDFSDNTTLYENEDGRAVMYFKEKNEYILISIDMS
jgi:hypothetical protein